MVFRCRADKAAGFRCRAVRADFRCQAVDSLNREKIMKVVRKEEKAGRVQELGETQRRRRRSKRRHNHPLRL